MLMSQTPFGITPIYDMLLRGSQDMPIGLYHLHMATAEQLCRLHYSPGTIKAVKARLKILVEKGYVQFDARPTKFFRSPYYYALDHLGMEYLRQAGMDINEAFRAGKEVNKHALFAQHTLELNDIIIAAALLKRSAPTYWLDSFIHERELKSSPYKATWQGGKCSLIPDAFLDFRVSLENGSQRRMPVVIEHDRGSEEQRYFRRRIRAYIILLKREGYKEWFQAKGITIAFTTSAGSARCERMREWTRQELAATNESRALWLTFYFTSLAYPLDPRRLWLEPYWFTLSDEQPLSLLGV